MKIESSMTWKCLSICCGIGLWMHSINALGTPDYRDLRPVLVYQTDGSLSKDSTNVLLKEITEGMSKGFMTAVSKSLYATDKSIFKSAMPYRGQLESLVDALRSADSQLVSRMARVKSNSVSKRHVNFQFFWTGVELGPSILPGDMLDLFLSLVTRYSPLKKEAVPFYALGESVIRTQTVSGNETLIDNLKIETFERFGDIFAIREGLAIWPVHAFMDFEIDGTKGVSSTIRMLFSSESMEQESKDMGTVILDKLSYKPMSQGRGVIEVELKRFYSFGAPTKEVPLLTIAFGRIRNGDVRPDSCKANECKEWLDALPTMYMKINPATNSWFTRTKAWVASFNQFRIMFRKIGVNLNDFSLDPGSTDLLFHVDGWLGGTKVIDMKSKANNWFEYFAQREGAIEGQILPEFDASARKSLNDMMTTNLDQLLFQTKK